MSTSTKHAEFQAGSREAAQVIHMLASVRLAEKAVDPETSTDELVKIYNSTKDVAGAVPEKKIDPNAGLATVHFTFVNGGFKGTVEIPPPVLETIQEVNETEDATLSTISLLMPTKTMLNNYTINADLSGLEE